jgi:hypothetical protein
MKNHKTPYNEQRKAAAYFGNPKSISGSAFWNSLTSAGAAGKNSAFWVRRGGTF